MMTPRNLPGDSEIITHMFYAWAGLISLLQFTKQRLPDKQLLLRVSLNLAPHFSNHLRQIVWALHFSSFHLS